MFKGSPPLFPFLPPFILCVLAIHPFIHRAKVVLCTRRGCCKAEMVSRRPRRPRRTFRCGDENNYALSSLSSSMCAKRCSLGSTWPGKGSLVTSVAGVAAAAAVVARPSARSHGAGGRASARANAVTRSMGQSLSARSLGRAVPPCVSCAAAATCLCVCGLCGTALRAAAAAVTAADGFSGEICQWALPS